MWLTFRLYGLFLWLTWQQPDEWGQCPWCGYDDWEAYMYKKPWFEATNGGTYYLPGEPTVHWAEGIQACPRCWFKWFTQDSD